MRFSHVQALLLAPLSAQAIRIVVSNDDGWAAKTVRVFVDTLNAAGQNVLLSGPAENKSGSCMDQQLVYHRAEYANIVLLSISRLPALPRRQRWLPVWVLPREFTSNWLRPEQQPP
jgi:hypothetical protein